MLTVDFDYLKFFLDTWTRVRARIIEMNALKFWHHIARMTRRYSLEQQSQTPLTL